MDWQTILLSIGGVILTALVSWGGERLIAWLTTKINNTLYTKHLTNAVDVITCAVKATYQTYVQALKDKNMFTVEAQRAALQKACETALSQLSVSTQKWVKANFGDINKWIYTTIESVIYDLKNNNSAMQEDIR